MRASVITFTLDSLTGHLPGHFPLQMQPASFKNLHHLQMAIFVGGPIPN